MRLLVEGPLGGAVGAGDEDLPAALAVAGGVEDDPFALAQAAEGRLVAEQLQGVDRLAALADQQPVVVLAADDGVDPVVVLADLDLTFKVELVEDPLDHLPDPLGRLRRPIPVSLTHAADPTRWESVAEADRALSCAERGVRCPLPDTQSGRRRLVRTWVPDPSRLPPLLFLFRRRRRRFVGNRRGSPLGRRRDRDAG